MAIARAANGFDVAVGGQVFLADGSADAAVTVNSGAFISSNEDQHQPRMVYDPLTHQFLVVWDDWLVGGLDVNGQLIAADGGALTSAFSIRVDAFAGSVGADPDGAFDPVNERFLVAWVDTSNQIHGGFVDADGTPASPFTIANTGNALREPSVAYDATNAQYLVVFRDGTANEIRAQRLDTDGATVGSDFLVGAGGDTPSTGTWRSTRSPSSSSWSGTRRLPLRPVSRSSVRW